MGRARADICGECPGEAGERARSVWNIVEYWGGGGGRKHGYCGECRRIWEFVGNGICRGMVDGVPWREDMNECRGLIVIFGYKEKSRFYIKNSMKVEIFIYHRFLYISMRYCIKNLY